jgi:Dyp-type peroxidase family
MTVRLDLHDIQGNILRGYRRDGKARFLFLRFTQAAAGRRFLRDLADHVTPARWSGPRPNVTLNVALSYHGLCALGLSLETTSSFPLAFREGMRARAAILGDTGQSAPNRWDDPWRNADVHLLVSCYSADERQLDEHCRAILLEADRRRIEGLGPHQEAARITIDGRSLEHFGFADGISNPAIEGFENHGNPNLVGNPDGKGGFVEVPAGEFILGYPAIGGEQRRLPMPGMLGRNGTFLVFRKLAQDVNAFRRYLEVQSRILSEVAGEPHDPAFLAAKMVGRWQDGSPLVRHPRRPSDADPMNKFDYADDREGALCPLGAHTRRCNPRSSQGLHGQLSKRRRMIRRGIPYGTFVKENEAADGTPRGMIFLAYMSGIEQQFEFVQQNWINSGDDFRQGNDKDPLVGDNDGRARMVVPGDPRAGRPPFLCTGLPRFVTVKGGEYFFVPGVTALRLLAGGYV